MADFLLELLSEEIPARMQAKARNDLARLFAEYTSEAGLGTGAIETYSTPRRLALIARDVVEATEVGREEIKGPRSNAPAQALEGFLRKMGLRHDQLEDRDGVYFAVIEREGRAAAEVIADAIKRIVANFPWPKSMRWGDGNLRWVRPLHGVVAILGEDIVPVEIEGIVSGAATLGHRFHHSGPITIGGASDYVEKLRACHVIVDQDERERLIREGAAEAARAAGLTLLPDEGLVVENAGLAEWPVPLLGRFDDDFLDVPREVIVLTMRTNQKYFACTNDEGLLAPAFVCVANIDPSDGGEAIAQGNARVLAARLADARFFWEQDLKVPLEEQAKRLGGIVFHEKLGTLDERSSRLASLVDDLSRYFDVDHSSARRAAKLAKADLVSGMVGEFPELQGVIGGYLAEAQEEPLPVSDAIRDHYKPAGQGDDTPSAHASIAVSLAEKLDSLVGFFGIGQPPTGSKDPFALRRAALAAIRLITENGLRIRLLELFPGAAQLYRNTGHEVHDSGPELLTFFADRLKVQQREAGVRHDLIDAVFALGNEDDLVRLLARVTALQEFVETDDGTNLLVAYKRAANILKKEAWEKTGASGGADLEPQEKALIDVLGTAEPKAAAAIDKEDFTGAMAALASLRAPIDAFFDHVTVNDPDAAKRERRLNLLMRFRDAVNRVADFSKIEG
ncbi:glycine--tRNA ligase subunit beta [Sphingomonas sp. URHD0057]|uniref:glycine--tRNA ligase subunit beta n=1 Tax=Sphingomonas sp. URHD0057 TaxID=1380389 RepID=UPI0004913171|nr:glycine--tRNA ligase subunit beta [Sphingomonas sp. URHD0057]